MSMHSRIAHSKYLLLCQFLKMIFLFVAVIRIYTKFYDKLLESLNPDDITAKLFSRNLITDTEKDELNIEKTTRRKNEALLEALKKAFNIDHNNFTTFLNILGEVSKYKPLVDSINAELHSEHNSN